MIARWPYIMVAMLCFRFAVATSVSTGSSIDLVIA